MGWSKRNQRKKLRANPAGVPVLVWSGVFKARKEKGRLFTMRVEEDWGERMRALCGRLQGEWSIADVVRLGVELVERCAERGEEVPELSLYLEGKEEGK